MSFNFGVPTTSTTTAPATNFSFGAPKPAAAAAPTFGSVTPAFGAAPAPTFGAPAQAAAPAFGAPVAIAPPAIGAPAATTTAFGVPAATTSAFGAPAAAAVAPTFGTPAVAAHGFGLPATSVAPTFTSGLGTATTTQPTLSFGAPAAATNAPPAFGAIATSVATTTPALTFGAVSVGLGGTATAATATPSFSFGTTATTSTGSAVPLFGGAATASIGAAPATAAVAPTLNFGAGLGGTPAPTTAAAPSFGFGSAVTSAGPTLGLGGGIGAFSFNKPAAGGAPTTTIATLNFGTTTTTATVAPFNTGLGGGNVGIFGKLTSVSTTVPTSATPFVGLGGIDVGATQPKAGEAKMDTVKVKETQVPDEIAKTVTALKQYIKEQKAISSDIARTPTSKFTNVSSEIANIQWSLQQIEISVQANYQHIKLLRSETSKTIQSVEMAQRTHDTPSGLQLENNLPFQYFQCLVARYEQDLIAFRQQIIHTERHMNALANPQNISPIELKRALKQINEAFISIAGRLHEIHQKVEEQKEHYLSLRRFRLRDSTNVFEKIDAEKPQPTAEPLRVTSGPTPFSNISAINILGKSMHALANTSNNTTQSTGMNK